MLKYMMKHVYVVFGRNFVTQPKFLVIVFKTEKEATSYCKYHSSDKDKVWYWYEKVEIGSFKKLRKKK